MEKRNESNYFAKIIIILLLWEFTLSPPRHFIFRSSWFVAHDISSLTQDAFPWSSFAHSTPGVFISGYRQLSPRLISIQTPVCIIPGSILSTLSYLLYSHPPSPLHLLELVINVNSIILNFASFFSFIPSSSSSSWLVPWHFFFHGGTCQRLIHYFLQSPATSNSWGSLTS